MELDRPLQEYILNYKLKDIANDRFLDIWKRYKQGGLQLYKEFLFM